MRKTIGVVVFLISVAVVGLAQVDTGSFRWGVLQFPRCDCRQRNRVGSSGHAEPESTCRAPDPTPKTSTVPPISLSW